MNEVIQNILTRRSIRTYKENQISDADLNTVLEAAQFAPTGMSKQGWHFTAVQNKEKIENLISAIKEAMLKLPIEQLRKMGENPNYNPFYNAPTLVITAYDKTLASKESDCAAALQNMLLAAHALNLGSCWIHILAITGEDTKVRSILTELGVPEDYSVFGTAVLGYNSKEEPKAAPRKEGTFNIVK